MWFKHHHHHQTQKQTPSEWKWCFVSEEASLPNPSMQQNTGTAFCPTVIITASSIWKECRKTRRKADWQTRGNREHERWRRKQTAQQDRRRRKKREGECVLSHPYRELQHNGAYNHDCQLRLTHQSAERHPSGQKNSITHDPSFVFLLPFSKTLLKMHPTTQSTSALDNIWCYKAITE